MAHSGAHHNTYIWVTLTQQAIYSIFDTTSFLCLVGMHVMLIMLIIIIIVYRMQCQKFHHPISHSL